MKIIFLDIDGVLNYEDCPYMLGKYYFVDDEKLKLLKKLIDETDAKIVLSSTWRYGWLDLDDGKITEDSYSFQKLHSKFKEFGLNFYSKTPNWSHHRGDEIEKWLEECQEEIESFIIIDDNDDMEPYLDQLIQTDYNVGLTKENIKEGIRLLNYVYKGNSN